MATEAVLKQTTWHKVETLLDPPQGAVWHYKNMWCAVDPQKGVPVYQGHAIQGNANENTAKTICAKIWPDLEVRFFEHLYVPFDPQEYAR